MNVHILRRINRVAGILLTLALGLLFLGCAISQQPISPNVDQGGNSATFTYLGVPSGFNLHIYRVNTADVTCYTVWGGNGTSISCPKQPKQPATDSSKVRFTNLGKPEGINGGVLIMQDGDQVCYLTWGKTGVGISCQ